MKQRLFFIVILSVLGLGIAALIASQQVQKETASQQAGDEPSVPKFGGPYNLTNHLGETVDETTYQGKYRLIYFGFTYCPAICPTELQKISLVLNKLGDEAEKITPLFITVDPERDDVDVMREYVKLFHPSVIGLTGTPEQIKQAADGYKIYYAKQQDETMSDYTMDHSSFIYFLTPDDYLIYIFKIDDDAETMLDIIRQTFDHYENKE